MNLDNISFLWRLLIFFRAINYRLLQIKAILANSTFSIHEILDKTTNNEDEDGDDDEDVGSDDSFEFIENNDRKNMYVSSKNTLFPILCKLIST